VRIFFGVKEIGRLQVRVAFLVPGAKAGDVDLHGDGGVGRVRFIEVDRAAEDLELAAHVRDHHVPH